MPMNKKGRIIKEITLFNSVPKLGTQIGLPNICIFVIIQLFNIKNIISPFPKVPVKNFKKLVLQPSLHVCIKRD